MSDDLGFWCKRTCRRVSRRLFRRVLTVDTPSVSYTAAKKVWPDPSFCHVGVAASPTGMQFVVGRPRGRRCRGGRRCAFRWFAARGHARSNMAPLPFEEGQFNWSGYFVTRCSARRGPYVDSLTTIWSNGLARRLTRDRRRGNRSVLSCCHVPRGRPRRRAGRGTVAPCAARSHSVRRRLLR